tara:strand:- start:1179 stop:1994 length:816 start_codon:yes stop_codon:yes gene_type:complete
MSKKKRRPIPRFQHPIIETHCHLDYLDEDRLVQILEESRQVGIEKIVTIAVSPDNLDKVVELSSSHNQVWGTQGIHPHDADYYNDAIEEKIKANLLKPRILAVGEIGLDYHYEHSDRIAQRQVFERQLQIASDADVPVVIHTREAEQDTRAILENFSHTLPKKGVIHSFTSSLDLAEYCLDQGFSLGFNGITTFNKAENVREVVTLTPIEKIVLETDAPYLTPVPYRGRVNAPHYLPFIAEKVAELKQIDVEQLLLQVYRNSIELLFKNNN